MPARNRAPILVTGSNRSGTTWVGDMLCTAPDTVYVHEPFNPQVRPQWFSGLPFERTQHIDETNASLYGDRLARLVEARPDWRALAADIARHPRGAASVPRLISTQRSVRRGARLVLKDPIGAFAADHLARHHGVRVVVCVRSPVAYAGSLKRMSWFFDFGSWTRQPSFMNGPAAPFSSQIEAAARMRPDIVDTAILRWNVTYSVLDQWRRAHPDWIIVEHSTLAGDVEAGFERLFAELDIELDDGTRAEIVAANKAGNTVEVADRDKGGTHRDSAATIDTWRDRLTDDEVERVRGHTADVAALYADISTSSW